MKRFLLISITIIIVCVSAIIGHDDDWTNSFSDEEKVYIDKYDLSYDDLAPYLRYKKFNVSDYLSYEKIRNGSNNYLEAINLLYNPYFYSGFKNNSYALFIKTNHILVNKQFFLDKDFEPTNLDIVTNYHIKYIKRDNEFIFGKKEALEKLELLFTDASLNGYNLYLFSGYRSYQKQSYLFYDLNEGKNNYVARPGFSEHQTGLAFDISELDYGLTLSYSSCPSYSWIKDNAHKYGFVLRYPLDKEEYTLYPYEPWHFRYVGINLATYMFNNNQSLEEYIMKNIEL